MEVMGATVVATFSFRPLSAGPARPTESADAGHVKAASLRMAAAESLSPLALASAKSVVELAEVAGLEERPHPPGKRAPARRTQARRCVVVTPDTGMTPCCMGPVMLSQPGCG